jgi:predicted ATP-grasp superfamily ATP-dependent carboligase
VQGTTTSTAAALVIGFTIQGLAVARALAKQGVKVYAIERAGQSTTFGTRYATIFHYEALIGERLVETLLDVRQRIPESRVVIFPASDNTVATLGKHWPRLANHYVLSWADCRDEIVRIIQKGSLPAYCDATGTSYPKTAVIGTDADIEACVTRLSFPVLVKPNKPASSFKTHIAPDERHLRSFVSKERENWPLVVQEWIDGPDSSLYFYSCFLDHGTELFGMTGRKVRASPPGLGRATVIQSLDDDGVRLASSRLIKALPVSGPASLEFKKDAAGRYWFIEANVGRTEFCIDLPIQAGFNVPHMEFNLALGRDVPTPTGVRHAIWFDTEKEPFSYVALCARHGTLRPFGKRLVFPYFGHGEPRLVAAAGIAAGRNIAQRALRKVWRSLGFAVATPAAREE